MRRWIGLGIAVAGALLAIGVGLVGYGTMLPVSHTAAGTVTIAARPEAVFDLVADPARGPQWRADVERVEAITASRWREHGADTLTLQRVELSRPTRYVVSVVEHPDFGGTWTWTFAPTDAGTEVTLTEDGEVYDPLFRAVMTLTNTQSATLRSRLQELQTAFPVP